MLGISFLRFFEIVALLGCGLTALKLFYSGLYLRYRFFFAYLVFLLPNSLWPLFLDTRSRAYFHLWTWTQPLEWLFYLAVVLELYRLVLESNRGIYTLGKWLMYLGMAVAVAVSVLSLVPHFNPAMPQQSRTMASYYAIHRGVTSSLALFLFLMVILLGFYSVRLSRNVIVHTVIYTIFFLSNTLAVLARNLFGMGLAQATNTVLTAFSAACMLAWFFLLNPAGEKVPALAADVDPAHEGKILYHLESLNSTLLKIAQK